MSFAYAITLSFFLSLFLTDRLCLTPSLFLSSPPKEFLSSSSLSYFLDSFSLFLHLIEKALTLAIEDRDQDQKKMSKSECKSASRRLRWIKSAAVSFFLLLVYTQGMAEGRRVTKVPRCPATCSCTKDSAFCVDTKAIPKSFPPGIISLWVNTHAWCSVYTRTEVGWEF